MGIQVIFANNGNTMVFNESGKQMPELQRSWLLLFMDFLKKNSIDPIKVDFTLPSGWKAEPFECSDGSYNWRISNGIKEGL